MRNSRRSYQMYVLNLDASRIFWLTTILLLLITLSFFVGLLIGKEKAKGEVDEIAHKNKVMMDEIIDKLEDNVQEDEEYQFYELISPEKINEKNRAKNGVLEEKIENPSSFVQKRNHNTALDDYTKEEINPKRSYVEQVPALDTGDKILSSERPYAVQVASYKRYKNANALKDYLVSEQYPAYIIKSSVNGILYYRVRIGPFASKALPLKVTEILRHRKGCENCFITTVK